MSRPKMNFCVLDPGSGKARPGAWVTVYAANTLVKAPLYADDDLSAISNPVQANGLGQVAVRINPGLYDISMVWDGAQPTVIEDVLAWVPEGAIIAAPGDLIVGDAEGDASRLPLATSVIEGTGPILQSIDGQVRWWHLGPGTGFPDGPAGSLVAYHPNGIHFIAIPPGTQDQALAIQGGMPTWVSSLLPPGTTLPISQPGDLVVGAVGSGLPARLPRGAPDQLLATDATGGLIWRDAVNLAGACALIKDGANLKLIPHLGNGIYINGRTQTIPSGGVTLAPDGLTIDTTYFIYAAMNPGLTLEASTTAHELTGGVYHKIGDPTRSLVGLARKVQAGWVDSLKQRFVLSLFSTMPRPVVSWFTAARTTSSTVTAELHPEIRVEWLSWANTPVTVNLSGMFWLPGPPPTPQTVNASIVLDGVGLIGYIATPDPAGIYTNASMSTVVEPAQGYHYLTLYSAVSPSGTVSWNGDPSGAYATRLHAMIPQ